MKTQFFGNNHSITLEEAKRMTKKFRTEKDKMIKEEYKEKHLPICESFDRSAFDALLQREDCKGIRIYYGMNDDSHHIHAVIVAIDADGKDILPIPGVVMDGTEAVIIDRGMTCPDYCPDHSDLNPPTSDINP
jgi:hypothetical protein